MLPSSMGDNAAENGSGAGAIRANWPQGGLSETPLGALRR
jgi:hypothetical protein